MRKVNLDIHTIAHYYFDQKMSARKVAEKMGVSCSTIENHLHRAGYSLRSPGTIVPEEAREKNGQKMCITCMKFKSVSSFGPSHFHKSRISNRCKECLADYMRKRRENGGYKPKSQLNYDLKRKYGITPEQYQKMHDAQGGLCAICGRQENKTYRGKLMRLQVDHCHTTGRIRGLLCRSCNSSLGMLGDDPNRLRKAIEYLEGSDLQRLAQATNPVGISQPETAFEHRAAA